jgi:hypothetical protein
MLAKAVSVKEAVERMLYVTRDTDHHTFVPNWGVATSEAWTILGRVVEIFLPTTVVISSLEGEKYVTQSLILLQLCHLESSVHAVQNKYPATETKNKLIYDVSTDLLQCLNELWDTLPIDTVIASILDPRTKWFEKIPKNEINEALKILKVEYLSLHRADDMISEDQDEEFLGGLFGHSSTSKKLTPLQSWGQDINLFQSLPKAPPKADPLLWWKNNQFQFPVLAKLAKMYLGIPASQASCERLFSIAKNDITETRTSMLPDLVESLLFLRKRRDILSMMK